jgi:pilus assembly protein CpaF
MQTIFAFEQEGIDEKGVVRGSWRATGVRPSFTDRLQAAGAPVPEEVFMAGRWDV